MRQAYNGTVFFLEQTERGNFAVLEMEDEPGVLRPYLMPSKILREADIVVYPILKQAQQTISTKLLNLINENKNLIRKNTRTSSKTGL
jgi:hypothetical protein